MRHYGSIDEIREYARSQPAGEILTESSVLSRLPLRRSQCYNDFYTRWHLDHFIGTYVLNDNDHEGSLVVYRNAPTDSYSQEQIALIELLIPHVRRAVDITLRLRGADASAQALGGALDSFSPGVFLLDRLGHVKWMNRSAEKIVAGGDGISVGRDGRLSAEATSIRDVISQVTSSTLEAKAIHFSVQRPSRTPAYLVVAAAVPLDQPLMFQFGAVAFLFVRDPSRSSKSPRAHFMKIYGLTPTEADLVAALADGKTLQEFAEERGIAVQTARAHLKKVLFKTETHRQTDLVRLILSSPAAIIRV